MTKLMQPAPRDQKYIEEAIANRRSFTPGALNDPATQDTRFYLNADKTAYLYLDGYELWFQPPNASPMKLA